jgi:TPR repeat protein
LKGAANSSKFVADQGDAAPQFNYGLDLKKAEGVSVDLNGATYYLKVSN